MNNLALRRILPALALIAIVVSVEEYRVWELNSRLESTMLRNTELTSELNTLSNTVESLRSELNTTRNTLRRKESELNSTISRLSLAERTLKEKERTIQLLNAEASELRRQIAELNTSLTELGEWCSNQSLSLRLFKDIWGLVEFLEEDYTDQLTYHEHFTCVNFSDTLQRNALEKGYLINIIIVKVKWLRELGFKFPEEVDDEMLHALNLVVFQGKAHFAIVEPQTDEVYII